MRHNTVSFKDEDIVKVNIRSIVFGTAIGILISVFVSIANSKIVSLKEFCLHTLFSLFISAGITNSVYLYERFLRPCRYNFWQFLAGYYTCNLVGMILGTEMSFIIISLTLHVPYIPLNHLNDYKYNLVIVFIAGTSMMLFQNQKISLQEKINLKELDLIKIKQLKTQAELQTIQAKINPHFLYNSLNSIACLVHVDAYKAEAMIVNLSRLFRYSMNASQENFSTVHQEVEILETYLAIEKIRFGDRIKFIVHADSAILNNQIPRFLIQPLVENAFKHGLNNTTENGVLEVRIAQKDQNLEISIADNGTDFPEQLELGYGLQSTYDKLNLLYSNDYQLQLFNNPSKQIKIILPSNSHL